MATTTVITDDIDGSPAETVQFSYGGTSYEIDLGKKNRAALEKALKPWIEAARKAPGASRRGSGRGRASRSTNLAAVRAWAAENGHQVAPRGRISQDVMDAYEAANK